MPYLGSDYNPKPPREWYRYENQCTYSDAPIQIQNGQAYLLDVLKKVLKEDEKIEIGDKRKLKNENVRDCVMLINKIMDYMKYLYPPVQQNVNVNIDMTADAVIERLKNWKKRQIIVEEENA